MFICFYMAQPFGTEVPSNPAKGKQAVQSTAQLDSKLPKSEIFFTHSYPFGGKRK